MNDFSFLDAQISQILQTEQEQDELFADVFESILQIDESQETQQDFTYENLNSNANFLENYADAFRKIEEMSQQCDADLLTKQSQVKESEVQEIAPMQYTEPLKAKQDFIFTISASEKCYSDKNTIPFNNIQYRRVAIDLDKFIKIIRHGFCFTSIFNKEKFHVKDKNEANWIGTQFVVFDIDNIREDVTLQSFVSSLFNKPTIAYTTPNNGIKKPKEYKAYSRFRLIYLFNDCIKSKELYRNIYNELESYFPLYYFDKTKKKDNCGASPVQQFSGNALPNCEIIINEEFIYNIAIFKSKDPCNPSSKPKPSKPTEPSKKSITQNTLNDAFYKDLNTMKPVDFLNKYKYDYELIDKTILHYENGYSMTPNDYVEIQRKYHWFKIDIWKGTELVKTKDGQRRRRQLFRNAKIRCQAKPQITLEELVYNAVYDRTFYFDNKDGVLSNKCLINICKDAKKAKYTMTLKKKPKFKIDRVYCEEHGISIKQMQNLIRTKLTYESIDEWYDPTKTLKKNEEFAKANGLKGRKDTLYDYCKSRGINPKGTKTSMEPSKPSAEQEAKRETIRANTLANIDFTEYRKKCKLYNIVFCSESTNRKRIIY